MVNQCANTSCGKPLLYLREGRIFVFDMPDPDKKGRHLQHFWLCGACSETLAMEQSSDKEIRVVVKRTKVSARAAEILPGSMAG